MTNTLEACSPNVNAIVSAAAGTGKTWLLIARILRLLLNNTPPATILAITFTDKAATEIQARLSEKLYTWTRSDDVDLHASLAEIGITDTQASLIHARLLYEKMLTTDDEIQIVTFHTFCKKLLQQFPFEIHIPLDFEILSDNWELQRDALSHLSREMMKTDSDLFTAMQTLTQESKSLHAAIDTLNNFLSHRNDWYALTENCKNPAADIAQALREAMQIDPDEEIILQDQEINNLKKYQDLLLLHDTETNCKAAKNIESATQQGISDNMICQNLFSVFLTTKEEKRVIKMNKELCKSLAKTDKTFDDFTDAFERGFSIIQNIKDKLLMQQSWHRNQAWYLLGNALVEIYADLKRKKQLLDFSDLEWLACKLMHKKGAEHIQYALNQRIRHILIDEFQDTNPNQWYLIKPLLEEMAAQDSANSVFIVGDIKQSIYSFRRANPELQSEAKRWLTEYMHGQEYTMNQSYRSSPEIIALVNHVFSTHSEMNDSETQTNTKISVKLVDFKPHETVRNTAGGCFALPFFASRKPADNVWRNILKDAPDALNIPPQKEEAQAVANKIIQVKETFKIHTPEDGIRAVRYKDIMILLRTRTHIAYFEEALMQSNIPFIASSQQDDSWEINDMLTVLRFLLHPSDNIAVAQILRCPIFAATDEDLILLAETHKQQHNNSSQSKQWLSSISALKNTSHLWERADTLLHRWLNYYEKIPLHDLLDTIYTEADVIYRYRLATSPEMANQVEANLSHLLDTALDFDSGRYPSVANFLTYYEERKHYYATTAQRKPQVANSKNSPDCVSILTIHQAKGLESPIVFLVNCGQRSKPHEAHNALVSWPIDKPQPDSFLLLPVKNEVDSFTQQYFSLYEQRQKQEEANLLYVALTRSRQYLFVSGSGQRDDACWYQTIKPYLQDDENIAIKSRKTTHTDSSSHLNIETAKITPPPLRNEVNPSQMESATVDDYHNYGDDEYGLIRGIVMHRLLEILTTQQNVEHLHASMYAEFPQLDTQKIDAWITQIQKLLSNEDLKPLFDNSAHQYCLNEVPISFIHQGKQIYGVIDRLCINPDSLWLVDYKTHINVAPRIDQLQKQYKQQIQTYAQGLSLIYPQHKIRTSLLFTDTMTLFDYPDF